METNISTQQDEQAVEAVRRGDAEHYRELVERHERRVYAGGPASPCRSEFQAKNPTKRASAAPSIPPARPIKNSSFENHTTFPDSVLEMCLETEEGQQP